MDKPWAPRTEFLQDLTKWINIYLVKTIILEPQVGCFDHQIHVIRDDGNIDRLVGALVDNLNRYEYYSTLTVNSESQVSYHHKLLPSLRVTRYLAEGHWHHAVEYLVQ